MGKGFIKLIQLNILVQRLITNLTGVFILKIDMATKLSRASVKLYQVRDYVNDGILKIIYYALFESHIHYRCMI